MKPVVALGHQPCGFIPKKFFYYKIATAHRISRQIGGEVVLFYHDSDHDYRETIVEVVDRSSHRTARLNFEQENKIQKKYSPLYAKRVPTWWKEKMLRQLPRFTDSTYIDLFAATQEENVADFCLSIYRRMGLLEGVKVVRSSDPEIRDKAIDLHPPYFVDLNYHGELVRAKWEEGEFTLHQGGSEYLRLPHEEVQKRQISPHSSNRLRWMQSVIGCTHYITGTGEESYLKKKETPEITFHLREAADDILEPIFHPVTYRDI